VLVAPLQDIVEINEADAALRTNIIVTALIGAVVAFCVFIASYYMDVLQYVEDYDLTERQAEVDSYEKTMVYACDGALFWLLSLAACANCFGGDPSNSLFVHVFCARGCRAGTTTETAVGFCEGPQDDLVQPRPLH
jgi:hypothetical protein